MQGVYRRWKYFWLKTWTFSLFLTLFSLILWFSFSLPNLMMYIGYVVELRSKRRWETIMWLKVKVFKVIRLDSSFMDANKFFFDNGGWLGMYLVIRAATNGVGQGPIHKKKNAKIRLLYLSVWSVQILFGGKHNTSWDFGKVVKV